MKTEIEPLKQRVEETFGQRVNSAGDFDRLRDSIYTRTGELFSATTLKRIWGYLNEDVTPRVHTLDVLSRYAGWKDWESFVLMPNVSIQSGPVGSSFIDVTESMSPGDSLVLAWLPNRQCELTYKGQGWFEIVSSCNTRLQASDMFQCLHIIDGEPLYLDHLTRDGKNLGVYVCGRNSGVRIIASGTAILDAAGK